MTIFTWFTQNIVVFQAISVIISAILLYGIIYSIVKAGYLNLKTERLMDALMHGNVFRRRSLKGWRHILKNLRSNDPGKWRLALREADRILDEILKMAGYHGDNLDERLENITSAQLPSIEEVRQAHNLSKKVSEDSDFPLKKEEADEAAYIYRKAFRELRLLD